MSTLGMQRAVREMPEDDRPRERLERLGPEALRDAELLAVLFRTGSRELGAVALAELLLQQRDGLMGLSRASVEEIQQTPGVGRVKAIEVLAALELGKRLATYGISARPKVTGSRDVYELLRLEFRSYETEHFKTLLLNAKREVLKTVLISSGTADQTMAFPRDVFRQAVREGAVKIVVAHNHPSGDPEPSQADYALTKRLREAGELLGIALEDHIIFGEKRYVSFLDRGLL